MRHLTEEEQSSWAVLEASILGKEMPLKKAMALMCAVELWSSGVTEKEMVDCFGACEADFQITLPEVRAGFAVTAETVLENSS